MLRKKKSALIACMLLACAAASILSGCSKKPEEPETVPPTQASEPAAVVTAPADALANVETEGDLESWEMTAAVWSSSNGATVTFKGHPRAYEEGQSASFVVRLEGQEGDGGQVARAFDQSCLGGPSPAMTKRKRGSSRKSRAARRIRPRPCLGPTLPE